MNLGGGTAEERMIACRECKAEIDVEEDELDEGDIITCDECGAELRVVSLDPLELEAIDEEEDDEDDLDEDDDEFAK
jgi:lysine biosynthesis protein LysW